MAGESRTELLAWVNDLLQLNLTKVRPALGHTRFAVAARSPRRVSSN